jgi:hypothetical protein
MTHEKWEEDSRVLTALNAPTGRSEQVEQQTVFLVIKVSWALCSKSLLLVGAE